MNESSYSDSHQSCIGLQIRAGIRAIPMADAVATGEVNCCSYMCNSQSFRTRSARGTIAQRNYAWLSGCVCVWGGGGGQSTGRLPGLTRTNVVP